MPNGILFVARYFGPSGRVRGSVPRMSMHGVTLLEVLVVVAIVAIVSAIAVPSFRTTIASNRLTTTANAYISNFNNARSAAIRRNAVVQFCGSSGNGSDTLGTQCGNAAAGDVYMLDNSSAAVAVAVAPALPPGLTLAPSAKALRFNGQGISRDAGGSGPYTGLVLDLSTTQLTAANRRCIYLAAGSVVTACSVSGTGACSDTSC